MIDTYVKVHANIGNNFIDPKHIDLHHHNFEILLNTHVPGLLKIIT